MLFTRGPKPPVLAAVPKLQKAVTCLMEKVLPWDSFVRRARLRRCRGFSVVNPQSALNRESLQTHARHKGTH